MTNELTKVDQDILDQLAEGSGENENSVFYNFIPYITINNSKEIAEVNGRETKVLCEPSFNITNKEGKDYITTLFAKDFEAVIIKFKHRVQRKLKYDPNTKKSTNIHPFFRSLEFSSFKSLIHIRQNEQFMKPMFYQQAKTMFGEELELSAIAYILIKGEDTIRKVEVKGASRGILFDYMSKKKKYPTASIYTKFSVEVDNEVANPYNKLKLEEGAIVENLVGVLAKQKELNKMLDTQSEPNEASATLVIEAPKKMVEEINTSEIDISKIFN
jgi:hypothetical protein